MKSCGQLYPPTYKSLGHLMSSGFRLPCSALSLTNPTLSETWSQTPGSSSTGVHLGSTPAAALPEGKHVQAFLILSWPHML